MRTNWARTYFTNQDGHIGEVDIAASELVIRGFKMKQTTWGSIYILGRIVYSIRREAVLRFMFQAPREYKRRAIPQPEAHGGDAKYQLVDDRAVHLSKADADLLKFIGEIRGGVSHAS